jgi:hypothetical protein
MTVCHASVMEEIVAVEVRLADGQNRYFLTWGRIQNTVEPGPVARIVLDMSHRFSLGGVPVSARLRRSLHDAAAEPMFFECFYAMCQKRCRVDDDYTVWRSDMDEKMRNGKEIYYLGRDRTVEPDEPHASIDDRPSRS